MENLVSVIVPVYNVEHFLESCLSSIVNQTYPNIEIILIDDGSTDNSGAICDKFNMNFNFVKVIHIKNHGVSYARNLGIEMARGKYLICVDSDDIIDSNMIARMTAIADEGDFDVVLCGIDLFNTNFYKTRRHIYENYLLKMGTISKDDLAYDAAMHPLAPYYGAPYNKLIKRQLLLDNSIKYVLNAQLAEDTCFNYELFSFANKIGVCSEILYHHRINAGASLSRKKHKFNEIAERISDIYVNLHKFCVSLSEKVQEEVHLDFSSKIYQFHINLIIECMDMNIKEKAKEIELLYDHEMVKKIQGILPFSKQLLYKNYYFFVCLSIFRKKILSLCKKTILVINKVFKII